MSAVVTFVEVAALALLALAASLAVARVVRAGSLPDKVLGADNFSVVVVAGVALGAGITEDHTFLDVLVVVTMLGFIGNLTVARYLETRGEER